MIHNSMKIHKSPFTLLRKCKLMSLLHLLRRCETKSLRTCQESVFKTVLRKRSLTKLLIRLIQLRSTTTLEWILTRYLNKELILSYHWINKFQIPSHLSIAHLSQKWTFLHTEPLSLLLLATALWKLPSSVSSSSKVRFQTSVKSVNSWNPRFLSWMTQSRKQILTRRG